MSELDLRRRHPPLPGRRRGNNVASVTVTPTAYDPDATVVVLPVDADLNAEGHQVSLTAGQANFITISVMSEDTTEVATYTIVINRA